MRIYLAAPLFTQAERAWNKALATSLTRLGHEVFLPQEAIGALDALEAHAIFLLDVGGVRAADALVAVLDGADADSGTSFECGLAFGLGTPIVAVRTDFRGGGDALPGQKLATVNLMLAQAAAEVVHRPEPTADLDRVAAEIDASLQRIAGGERG
jgi:nucleoside 2-deoxyribosyltransferase